MRLLFTDEKLWGETLGMNNWSIQHYPRKPESQNLKCETPPTPSKLGLMSSQGRSTSFDFTWVIYNPSPCHGFCTFSKHVPELRLGKAWHKGMKSYFFFSKRFHKSVSGIHFNIHQAPRMCRCYTRSWATEISTTGPLPSERKKTNCFKSLEWRLKDIVWTAGDKDKSKRGLVRPQSLDKQINTPVPPGRQKYVDFAKLDLLGFYHPCSLLIKNWFMSPKGLL